MTIYYLCHINADIPMGGVKVLYNQVDLLTEAGVDAAIVHSRRGFRCTWFPNQTRVVHPTFVVNDQDLLVFPEAKAAKLDTVAPGVGKVVVNQNAHYTFDGLDWRRSYPYLQAKDLLGVT